MCRCVYFKTQCVSKKWSNLQPYREINNVTHHFFVCWSEKVYIWKSFRKTRSSFQITHFIRKQFSSFTFWYTNSSLKRGRHIFFLSFSGGAEQRRFSSWNMIDQGCWFKAKFIFKILELKQTTIIFQQIIYLEPFRLPISLKQNNSIMST